MLRPSNVAFEAMPIVLTAAFIELDALQQTLG